jgi:hypothetical protein
MRVVRVVPGMAVLLALVAATGITGCTGSSGPGASTASQPASLAASASLAATSPAAASSRPAPAPAATSSAAPPASATVKNLIVTPAMRSELLAAYAAFRKIPASDVRGVPGTVYYAYVPATGTYWALAEYEPVSGDSLTVEVGFQDGGSVGFFKRAGSGPWQVSLGGEPEACTRPLFFPRPVLAAWSLSTSATPPSGC